VLKSFPAEERAGMVEDDGVIRVTCEYCARTYEVTPDSIS
jgi:molecular chaperone Hsp33